MGAQTKKKIISIEKLAKDYCNKVRAVNEISFDLFEGEFLAFLGVNGAGKSTTINILSTLLEKSSGKIFVDGLEVGEDDDAIRSKIGIVFQDSILDSHLTVRENLEFKYSLYEKNKEVIKTRVNEVINQLELNDYEQQLYKDLSGGQRRRADIARSILHKPSILILDEPTTGLDPHTRVNVWKTIKRLKEENNMSILLTTHYMEETNDCDRVVIIDKGVIAEEGTPEDLRIKYSYDKLMLVPKDSDKLLTISKDMKVRGLDFVRNKDTLIIRIKNSIDSIELLNMHHTNILSFEMIQGSMDDVFVNLTSDKEV